MLHYVPELEEWMEDEIDLILMDEEDRWYDVMDYTPNEED